MSFKPNVYILTFESAEGSHSMPIEAWLGTFPSQAAISGVLREYAGVGAELNADQYCDLQQHQPDGWSHVYSTKKQPGYCLVVHSFEVPVDVN